MTASVSSRQWSDTPGRHGAEQEGAAPPEPAAPASDERAGRPDRAELSRLVAAASHGDRDAFSQLVSMYRTLVTQVARRYVSRNADVDDVVQEVWIKLWEHLDTIERPEALPGWLRRVTTNVAFRLHARGSRLVFGDVADVPALDLTDDVGVHRTILIDVQGAVGQALGRLKDSDRQLVELLMVEDRPDYRAVSQQINRPVGSIGPTRQRIFERLRRDPAINRLAPTGAMAVLAI
jgi:RNA polymerase sigma factor (sigma-70 family)